MAKINIEKLSELTSQLEKENIELISIVKDLEKLVLQLDDSIYNSPEKDMVHSQLISFFKQANTEIPLSFAESINSLNLLIQKSDEINNELNYTNSNNI